MTETMDKPLNGQDLDRELGSRFDWLEFPTDLDLEKAVVTDYPDRSWVREVEHMLDRDGKALAVYQALSFPLRQANLTLEKPDGVGADRITEFIREVLWTPPEDGGMRTPVETLIGQHTYSFVVRRSYHEAVPTLDSEGRVVWRDIAFRPAASCELVRDRKSGRIVGIKQFVDPDRKDVQVDKAGFVMIPRERSVVHINGQDRSPLYGVSDLTVAYWAYEMKQKVLRLWTRFMDRASMPKAIVYGNSPAEAKQNARIVSGLSAAGVVAMTRPNDPTQKAFEVLDTTGQTGSDVFLSALRYFESVQSGSVLAGWMDLTSSASEGLGSYALSADQSGLFLSSRHGAAREIAGTWNTQIIAPLVRYNFGPKAPVPKLKFEKINQNQVQQALALLQQLATAPNLQVPQDFLMLLLELVGQYLDLPDDRVQKIVREAAAQARADAAGQGAELPSPGTGQGTLTDVINGALGATNQPTG